MAAEESSTWHRGVQHNVHVFMCVSVGVSVFVGTKTSEAQFFSRLALCLRPQSEGGPVLVRILWRPRGRNVGGPPRFRALRTESVVGPADFSLSRSSVAIKRGKPTSPCLGLILLRSTKGGWGIRDTRKYYITVLPKQGGPSERFGWFTFGVGLPSVLAGLQLEQRRC